MGSLDEILAGFRRAQNLGGAVGAMIDSAYDGAFNPNTARAGAADVINMAHNMQLDGFFTNMRQADLAESLASGWADDARAAGMPGASEYYESVFQEIRWARNDGDDIAR